MDFGALMTAAFEPQFSPELVTAIVPNSATVIVQKSATAIVPK
jgi:hypothetical protein